MKRKTELTTRKSWIQFKSLWLKPSRISWWVVAFSEKFSWLLHFSSQGASARNRRFCPFLRVDHRDDDFAHQLGPVHHKVWSISVKRSRPRDAQTVGLFQNLLKYSVNIPAVLLHTNMFHCRGEADSHWRTTSETVQQNVIGIDEDDLITVSSFVSRWAAVSSNRGIKITLMGATPNLGCDQGDKCFRPCWNSTLHNGSYCLCWSIRECMQFDCF